MNALNAISEPKVSVVLTCYRTGPILAETIQSVLDQSFGDFELIVLDDCSGDETPERVRAFDDPRIRLVVNEENLGISATRNKGMTLARGTYMAPMDHDDLWMAEKLEKQIALMDTQPETVLAATGTAFQLGPVRHENPLEPTDPILLHWALFERCPFVHSSVCMRLATLRQHGIEYKDSFRFGEDYELYHQFAKHGRLAYIPQRLTVYRVHGENWSIRQNTRMNASGVDFLSRELGDWLGLDLTRRDVEDYWTVMIDGQLPESREQLARVGETAAAIRDGFCSKLSLTAPQRSAVFESGARRWWRTCRIAANNFGVGWLAVYSASPAREGFHPALLERLAARTQSALPAGYRRSLKRLIGARAAL